MTITRLSLMLTLTVLLAACGASHKGRPNNFSANHMTPLISYSIPQGALPSAASIEDILGQDYQLVGDVNGNALAWKKRESGLTAIVEYAYGCQKKAMLLDEDGHVLALERDYKRCDI